MKKLFQISLVLLSLFLLNGNGFLYAHTNKENKAISLEKVFSATATELLVSNFDNQVSIPTLQSDTFPSGKKRSERFKLPLFEKEEKEKEDKLTSLEETASEYLIFSTFSFEIPLFDKFYHYNKNYLRVSESLNYFLCHKCYILFQVFRL